MPNNPFYTSREWRERRREALIRDLYRCVVPGCRSPATIVDHIETRPDVPYLCEADELDNLRSVCRHHDNQVKELGGIRRRRGEFALRGSDVDGWPKTAKC